VAPSWRWLLVAVAAVALSLCAPGSLLTQAPGASRTASIEALVPTPGGSECAAVACNRGAPANPGAVPTVTVVGVLVAAWASITLRRTWRRTRATRFALPAGSPLDLLRPPQRPQRPQPA